ncbi:MAG: alpha/beta hydrolase [Solirubrobacteraceae bacterium]
MSLVLAGCGGGVGEDPVTGDGHADKLVSVRTVEFPTKVDGTDVTGLMAVPRGVASRGCVIWQFGFRSTKENADYAWQGLAAVGLTTFSIDMRSHGARAADADEYQEVVDDPEAFDAMVRGTIGDFKSATDFLEKQPECDGHVGFAGVSLGGAIGTVFAAQDKRIEAVVLAVTPGSWRQVVTAPESPMLRGIVDDPKALSAALKTYDPLDPARYVGRIAPRPVLIISGKSDQTVVFSNARKLQKAAREPKTIFNFNGGHNPVVGPDAERVGNDVGSFLLRTMVQPTYGIDSGRNATFYERKTR